MAIKKLRMNQYLRKGLVVGASILSMVGIILMIKEYRSEHVEEQSKTVYEYTIKDDVKYSVHVKPNLLYEEAILGEGEMYLTEFVDYITADFTSDFSGTQIVDIEGSYGVSAEIIGYTIKQEEKQIVWRKLLELSPTEKFKKNVDRQAIRKQVRVNFPEYNDFAKAVLEASKVNLDVELVVTFLGNKNFSIPHKPFSKELKTALVMPLNKGYFSITKEGVEEKADKVQETIEVPIPIEKGWMMMCVWLVAIGIIGAVCLLLFTDPFNEEDLYKKKIKTILNEHGSRMVAVEEMKLKKDLELCGITSIEDLIKLADELELPVFYEKKEELLDIDTFYVKTVGELYSYVIKRNTDIFPIEEVKESET